MDGEVRINPYLSGNFAPVRSEDDYDLPVKGEIPAGLRGALFRTGPNPQFDPIEPHHWFFGDGMVHGFYVEDGKVRYRNRYVRTPKWELEHEHGRAMFSIDPRRADPLTFGNEGGVANTNIVWHGGKLLALEEAHQPFEMDPRTWSPAATCGPTAAGSRRTRRSIPQRARWCGSPTAWASCPSPRA
jgi:carotenoid cleavage dioxygenase